jgi:DNA mismatch endonuclease (patch repair protein)
MADMFTRKKRSEIMSLIRAKNTGIEKKAFAYLRKNKVYFYRHYAKAPGKPDIALPKKKIAVFIDGDFWHGYQFKRWRNRIPKEYWRDKIAMNIARDAKNRRTLRRQGWRVMRIWGHEITSRPEQTFRKIAAFLKS